MSNKFKGILISMFLIIPELNAQEIEAWIKNNDKVPVEKIYLHTDRELYFAGETIWLKSYITVNRSGRLKPGAENVYLQLTNENGNPLFKANLMSVDGQAPGHMFLPDTIMPGNYILIAYTDYMLNFGNESFFNKTISVIKPSPPLPPTVKNNQATIDLRKIADISFLPEGGKLLEGIANLVAFKAIDENGYGVDASGSVLDESGKLVVSFKSDYKGMGLFFLTPEYGKTYHAVINEFPKSKISLDSLVVTEGVKLQLLNQTSRDIFVNITSNSDRYLNSTYYLVNRYRGNTLFYQPVKIEENNQLVRFDSQMLRAGINQMVLLDNNLRPVSEQLIFSDNLDVNELKIIPDNIKYGKRAEVNLAILDDEEQNELSNISVSIVHEAVSPDKGNGQDILSWLLISSELKGFIENPADFFSDSIINARAKQRLLMLTNGWSSYFWNSVPSAGTELKFQQKAGLELHGIASNVKSGDPLKNEEISMIVEKDKEMAILTQTTDKTGRFTFSGMLFNDTANVYIQSKRQRGRQKTQIILQPENFVSVSKEHIKSLKSQIKPPDKLQSLHPRATDLAKYRRAERIQPTSGIPANSGDGHFRLYEQADQVLEVPERESSYGNIIEFLQGKVAGMDVSGDNITFRGSSNVTGNSGPLFLVDGVPLIENRISEHPGVDSNDEFIEEASSSVRKVKSIPIGDIEKVEILKTPQNLAIFGVEGANGVIAIYTRKGREEKRDVAKDVLEKRLAGYSSYRKYYAPKYLPGAGRRIPFDFRTTLFWEPEVVLRNGKDSLNFFTSDQAGKYIVTAEGISESGKICKGTASIVVE